MAISKRSIKTITFSLIILLLVILSIVAWPHLFKKESYQRGYAKIQIGDSKQSVVGIFGPPTKITDCYDFTFSTDNENLKKACVEEYWYKASIEQWVFVFDKNHNVISKSHNISY